MVDGILKFNTKMDLSGVDKGTKEASSKVLKIKDSIANTEAEIGRLKNELKSIADVPVDTSVGDKIEKDLQKAIDKQKEVIAKTRDIENEYRRLSTDSKGNFNNKNYEVMLGRSSDLKKLDEQYAESERQIASYERQLEDARRIEAQTTGKDTAAYREKEQRINELSGKLNVYQAQLRETRQKEAESGNQTRKTNNSLKVFKQYASVGADVGKKLSNSLKQIAQKCGDVAKRGLSKVASGIKNFISDSRKANSQLSFLGKGIKRIERMIVGMIFYKVFRQGIQAIGEALGQLSKESPAVNKHLSALLTSLTYLKNSFAAAFAPILSVVTPILTNFMDTLAKTINKVGNFIAVLTGNKIYQQAVKVQQDYAKSLDKTTKSTNKLSKANKSNLASFDQLNVMEQKSNSNNGSNDVSTDSYFKSVPTVFNSFADRLRKAFLNGKYETLGQLVADKLNKGMESVKWNKIRSTAKKWANNIASFLNGAVVKLDWKLVGSTIGNGLMTAVDFSYAFLTKFKWIKLGKGIANLLNGAIKTINWKKLGKTISSQFNALIDTVYGFVITFKWGNFGSALHIALSNAFKNIKWDRARQALISGINGIFSTLVNFIGTPDFTSLGSKTAQGLTQMLNGINWETISNLFSTLVVGALDFIDGFTLTINWQQLGDDIATSFKSFFTDGAGSTIIQKMVTTLTDLICGLLTTLDAITLNIDWEAFGQKLASSFEIDTSDKAWQNLFAKTASDIVNATLDFINGLLSEQSTADKLVEGVEAMLRKIRWKEVLIKSLSGLINVASWLIELAGDLVDKFCKGLATGFSDGQNDPRLKKAIDNLGKAIGNLFLTALEALLKIIVNAIPNFVLGLGKTIVNLLAYPLKAILGDEWYAGIENELWGANSLKVDIPIKLPRLASGTVVPASYGEFLAVLGDNKKEPEVVSPLSTMKQAFIEAIREVGGLGGENTNFVIVPNGERLFEVVRDENKRYKNRTGRSAF